MIGIVPESESEPANAEAGVRIPVTGRKPPIHEACVKQGC